MAHARTQIRNAVVAALTGLSTTGARVHASRMRPTDALPALLITTDAEVIEQGAQRRQMRTMDIVVRGLAKGGDGVDDTLDQIALEVETAMQSSAIAALAAPCVLSRVDIEFDDALEKPVGMVVIAYRAVYFTQAGAPAVTV